LPEFTKKSEHLAKLRDDIVVSVCISDLTASESAFHAVRKLVDQLDCVYRFREIILVVSENERDAFLQLVQQVSDVRLFTVLPSTEYYERRVIAAEEAIGDLVIIANMDELAYLDIQLLLDQSEETSAVVLTTRSNPKRVRNGLFSPLHALGKISGFKISANDLQTIALPRTLLNQLLLHREPQLALRFPPRDTRLPLELFAAHTDVPTRRLGSDISRRVKLLQKLLVYLAPTLLVFVSLTSTVLTFLGICYAIYTVAVWIFVDNLAAGWLTISGVLSLSAMFIGLSMLGLSLGLQQLLGQHKKATDYHVAEEINRIDLFGKVSSDLNVELENDTEKLESRGQ
jgi:hypothetical protein